jgi:hypothetical protein
LWPRAWRARKIDRPPGESASEDGIRRRAKGRVDRVLARIGQSFELIKPAAANDADGWFLHRRVIRVRRLSLKTLIW